jgi:hypothetical protein
MIQVTNVCSKCKNEIEHGKEQYIQLIDRQSPIAYADEDGAIVVPRAKWEWCLCPKCFEAFNNGMAYPYKEQ